MNDQNVVMKINSLFREHGSDLKRFRKEMGALIREGRDKGDFLLIGSAYYYLALANWKSGGDRDAVLLNAIKASAMLDQTKDYRMIARSDNMLGIAYLGQENYQMALDSYNRAYKVAKDHKSCNIHDRLLTLNNIADCYYEMGDYKSSLKVFKRCLKDGREKASDKLNNLALYCINLANNYGKLGYHEKALEVLDEAADWIDRIEMKMWTCLYYSRRAAVLYSLGRFEEGNECADRSLAIIGNDSDTYEFHKEFEEIAHALIDHGDFDRAMRFAAILSEYSEKNVHTIDLLMTGRVMAHYYSRRGERERALETYEELNRLYEKRLIETKAMQLTILKKIKEANREISKLTKSVRASAETASKDPLSGLLNRSALLTTASEFMSSAAKKKEKVGAVFIDIDMFKECNDTYGHAKGDEVIKLVANACLEEESAQVRFARYGGDEFFGMTHGLTTDRVISIARSIAKKIESADVPNEKSPYGRITLSIGLINVRVAPTTNTIIDVVNCADKALYHAKESGRNAIFMFDFEHLDENGRIAPYIKVDL